MEPFSTASMLAIAGKLVTTEVTKAAVAGIKRQLQPDEMAVVLQKSIESAKAAEAVHSPTSGLFYGFQPKAGQEFLEKFLRSSEVVKELQKPLQDDGKPDVEMLVAAFTKAAADRSEAPKYLHCLRPWMEAFVESYFQQVKGICFQVANQAELPRQRCKLYEKAVETLLTSWDSGKEIKLYSQVLLFLKSDNLLYILKKLAYWIHTQGSTGETEGGTLIDKEELIRWLRQEIQTLKKCEAHEAKGEAERFIDFIQRRTGLLNEQGRDRYAFVHKTFQEYLTAEEIFDRADVEDDTEIILVHFRQHLHDQHWREVLLLLVSKLKGKKAQKAIQAVLDARSEYEQWLHRDLLFAGWCLTEDPPELTVVAADWVGEILDRLLELEIISSIQVGKKVKMEVEKILHCFGETSINRDVWAKLEQQEEKIDRFRLVEFQVSLGQGGEKVDRLLSLLEDTNSDVRSRAAYELGKLGNDSPEVVSGLLERLYDEDSRVSSSAAYALVDLGNSSPEVVSDLIGLLDHENPYYLYSAIYALGELGKGSPEVVSGLLGLLYDEDSQVSSVRSSAAYALGELGKGSPEVVSGLLELLYDEDSQVSSSAADALVKLGNSSPEVVSALVGLLSDEDRNVRSRAAHTLVKLGNSSPTLVSALVGLLSDRHSYCHAANALVKLGNSTALVSGLLELLGDKHSYVRCHAADALGELGNSSPALVSGLVGLLDDENNNVRSSAVNALGKLGKTADEILPTVVQWLERKNRDKYLMGTEIDCLWSFA
jgi:HEAT repeat protein